MPEGWVGWARVDQTPVQPAGKAANPLTQGSVAKPVDAPDLGSGSLSRIAGSSPAGATPIMRGHDVHFQLSADGAR